MILNTYIGRIVFDIEIKNVKENSKVINNRIAISNSKENTCFIDISAWDKTAELINEYYKKGEQILFQGILKNKEIKIDDKSYIINEILVKNIIFTNSCKKED